MNEIESRAAELLNSLLTGGLQDPYPTYAALRELGDGIHWSDILQAYIVTRYEDLRRIAGDHDTFSSNGLRGATHDGKDVNQERYSDIVSKGLINTDPPTHTRIRSMFRHAFTPAAVTRWEPLIARVAEELIDRYPRGEEFDLMPGFAADVPISVIAEILGVPAQKRPKFREWTNAYASTFDPTVQGEQRNQAINGTLDLIDYLGSLVQARRIEPRDDLITVLVHTETSDGDHLGDTELLAQLALLLVAGNDTTTSLIGNGLTLLLDNPDALDAVRSDRSLLPAAVEEMLRIDPPLHFVMRKTTKNVVLGEHELPGGSVLWASPAAANRDPRRFADPDRFVITRKDNKHLAFFHGIHFCVGAPLGRMEARLVFNQILDRYPDFRAGEEQPRRSIHPVSRGWESRPVVL
jgi:cytochrome P450